MDETFDERTLDPTPHRREQARREGRVAKSQDLASAALLIGGLLTAAFLGHGIVDYLSRLTQFQLGGKAWMTLDQDTVVTQWHTVVWGLARVMLPMFGLILIVAVLANALQIGFVFLPKKLALDVGRVNPITGFSRLFSMSNVVRLGFGIFKILVVAGVAYWSLWGQRNEILAASAMEVSQFAAFVASITFWTCLKIGIALLVLALLDYAFQRWKHEQDLRMTPQEFREEMKQQQGDPQVVARRRTIQRQLSLNRLATTVPQSDVVITSRAGLAIAIKYDSESMIDPIVLSKGNGTLAQRIHTLAVENNIPVVQREDLAYVLFEQADVSQPIPANQYASVAEVLHTIYESHSA